jgi:enterochelin esterase family protein
MIPATFYRYFDSIYPHAPAGPVDGNMDSWFCYGWSAAHTPNSARPPYYCDFPFDYPSGEVFPHLWEQWLSHDPVVNWASRVENLRALQGILLDVGYRDEYNLHYVHRILSKGLRSANIAHDVEEYDGPHTTHVRERVIFALTWFSQVLSLHAGGEAA